MSHIRVCWGEKDTKWHFSALWSLQDLPQCQQRLCLSCVSPRHILYDNHQLRQPAHTHSDKGDLTDFTEIFAAYLQNLWSDIPQANWCHVCPLVCFTRSHRGTGRNAVAPRGTAAATHSKLPKTALTRDVQAPRARGGAGSVGYRPPLLAVTHESYDDYVSPILFAHRGQFSW